LRQFLVKEEPEGPSPKKPRHEIDIWQQLIDEKNIEAKSVEELEKELTILKQAVTLRENKKRAKERMAKLTVLIDLSDEKFDELLGSFSGGIF